MKTLFSFFVALGLCPFGTSAPPPPVTAVAYHPDGKLLAAGSYGEVLLIDPAKGEVVGQLDGQTDRVTALAFSKTGDRLAVGSGKPGKSGEIRVYQIKNGNATPQASTAAEHSDIVYALAFSPDGKQLASAGYDRVIQVVDPANPKTKLHELKDHSDTVYGLSFHPNGKLLASCAADRAVKVWDVAANKRLYTLSDPTDWVHTVAWSPDGKHLAAAGIDKSIRVWTADADGGKLVYSVFAHTQPVTRLVYSKDGKTLYSIGEGPNIKSWNTATMKEIFVHPPQAETMLCLALSPDQKQLAVGFFDGKLKLIEADTGKTTAEPLPVKPKPPVLMKLTPNSGIRGQTVRVAIEGQNLSEVNEVAVEGMQTKIIEEGRTATRLEADVVIPPSAATGSVNLSLKSPAGASTASTLFVDRYPVIAEAGPKDSPRTGMKIKLPATLTGVINKAGDADWFRFEAKEGQEVAVQAFATKFEEVLEITDENGKLLAESGNGLLGIKISKAGTYALGVRDKEFRGGADFAYRISLGDFPLITGVSPLSIQRGKESLVDLHGVNLGSNRQVKMTIPADALPGSKHPLSLPKLAEKPVGEAQVVAGEFPEQLIVRNQATIPVPGTATGSIDVKGDEDRVKFPAKKGQRLIVEVEARRLGSPLDSIIEIVDEQGKLVPRATLRSVARTFSIFRDNDSATPGIRLEAWNELAIDDYLFVNGDLMRINALPKGPDDDCQFYQIGGQRRAFLDTTPTHHYLGNAMYKVEIHPPATKFPPNGMPVFDLVYRNDDGGPGYGKDSRLFFDPPADGHYTVRIRDARNRGGEDYAYRLTVRPPKPSFTVKFDPISPSVWKGGSVPINVTATRIDGFDGTIDVELMELPPGFSAPKSFIEPGQQSTTFPLFAEPNAKLPEKKLIPLKLFAKGDTETKNIVEVKGIHTTSSLGGMMMVEAGTLKLTEPGDIVTSTNIQEVTIKPGEETKLTVTIERRNKFTGRVPLEVRGLPHGVRVLNIGLNGILVIPGETQREVVLYAEPWVKPMEHPFIVLAKREGKNTEHGAKPVLLKVK